MISAKHAVAAGVATPGRHSIGRGLPPLSLTIRQGETALLDDPTPVCVSNTGCPAMVRRGAGQWADCGAPPAHAGWVDRVAGRPRGERVRVFPCEQHAHLVQELRPISDDDRAEVQRRRDAYAAALERAARNRHAAGGVDPA
jgi:hypothetical protein